MNKMNEEMTKKIMSFYAPGRIEKYESDTGAKLSPAQKEKLIETFKNGDYKVEFNNTHHLKFMTETMGFGSPGFTNMFYGQKWKIYIAKGRKRFITSDTPVVEWWLPPQTFYGASFLERNKYFALTPEIFFELTYPVGSEKIKRKTIFENEDATISIFNVLLTDYCHKVVYSGDKAPLDELLAGREHPGPAEFTYYNRYQRPWAEVKRCGDT